MTQTQADERNPMIDREQGDAHPQLNQRSEGAYYTGDLLGIMESVAWERRIVIRVNGDFIVVEFRETDGENVAEDGAARTFEAALRYALGAYLD